MRRPRIDKDVREKLLKKLEDEMAIAQKHVDDPKQPEETVGYWEGRVDGLNRAFRLISSGYCE